MKKYLWLLLIGLVGIGAVITNVVVTPISKYPNTNSLPNDALFVVALTNVAGDGITTPTNKNIRYSDLKQLIINSLATTQYVNSAVSGSTNYWNETNSTLSPLNYFVDTNLTILGDFNANGVTALFGTFAGAVSADSGDFDGQLLGKTLVIQDLGTNNFLLSINSTGLVGVLDPSTLGVSGSITGQVFKPLSVVVLSLGGTGATNVLGLDLNTNNNFVLTATTNAYFASPSSLRAAQSFSVWFYQDSTGNRLWSFDTNVWKFPGGVIQAATTNASGKDILSCVVGPFGTNVHVVQTLQFQ